MRFLIFIFLALVLDLACGQYHSSSATAGVNFENLTPSNVEGSLSAQSKNRARQRRMYAMCPPNFQRIGQECFTHPQQHSSWLEAHFFCKDKNAQLAEPEKYTDEKLRKFLMKYDEDNGSTDPIWIGATYDYINHVWQWAISEHNSTYNAFSKKYYERNPDMTNQCAVYDPQLKYRWSSRTCVDKHRFICQHKMPKVSEKNRYKVYLRWNATYPNEYANEVVLEVIDHKGKGRYNRRVKAEGSNEEMVIPSRPRSRQNGRRRNRPTSASLPQENDVNYHAVPSDHPNDIQQNIAPTKHPRFPSTTIVSASSTNNNYNEITAPKEGITVVPDKTDKKSRRRTTHDRKLQRQREKELRRLQRKKERQERMRREKEERLQKMRLERDQQRRKIKEEKKNQRSRQQKVFEELRQKETDKFVERLLGEKQYQYNRQQEFEAPNSQKKTEEKKHLEYQEREEQRLREERKVLDEGKRKEYEEKLKHAESERARQLAEEQERKRLQDEADRRKLEEEEKERQTELQRKLEEEEERLRLDRLEEERIAEEKELERLREEQRKRAEIQRKREEEIARVEAEQRRIELEEARIKEELEEAERQAKIQHESEIRKSEEEARAKEEERKRAEEQEERERQEKLKQAKAIEESRKSQNKENLTSRLKNRFESLSPELRKEFLERRKQRKREKQLREKMLHQQQHPESTNNEA